MSSSGDITRIWAEIVSQHDARADRLVAELRGAWADLDAVVSRQALVFPPDRRWEWPDGARETFEWLFDDVAEELLETAVSAYNTTRPQRRALKALHEYQSGLEQLVRSAPAEVDLAPAELAEALHSDAKSTLRAKIALRQRKVRTFPLRDVLTHYLREQTDEMASLNGRLLLALAKGSMALIEPWEVVRREALRKIEGRRYNRGPYRREADRWLRGIAANRREGERQLARFGAWRDTLHYRLEAGILAGRTHHHVPGELPLGQLPFAAFWSRQRQALSAQLDLECRMVSLGRAAIRQNQLALSAMTRECRAALEDLSDVETWLENWKPDAVQDFPRPELNVTSARNRTADWLSELAIAAREKLPATVELGEPRGATPGWRDKWQKLHPHRLFKQSLEEAAEPTFFAAASEAESGHAGVLVEIERCREVIAFGMETAESDGPDGNRMASEVVSNLLASVRYQKEAARELSPEVARQVTAAAAAAFSHAYLVAEQGRLGVARHLARQGFIRSLQGARRYAKIVIEWGEERVKSVYRRLLESIGWEYAPDAELERVTRREYLSEELNVDLETKELPLIYQRLFRLQPIDDDRLLVGRDRELAALGEARWRWQRGRSVAVVIVGERGSGKTSLLSCGIKQVFSDCEVVRGDVAERVRSADELNSFLRNLLGLPPDADLRAALTDHKRIVVLEEIERCFLREPGGFSGIRELLALISNTYKSTLWLLSLNASAFDLLNPVTGMGKYFSHRINAMAVSAGDLESAIRLRHNFSGLRLQFASVRTSNTWQNRLQRMAGLEDSPEQLFFDSIFRLSGGVFRSAFEIWQAQIDRAEAGILHMKHPEPPDYSQLLHALDHQDVFSLQAILQHGSLTAREHAAIFRTSEAASMSRLDHLIDREILHQDPNFEGFRVRPAAGSFVRRALHAQNLV